MKSAAVRTTSNLLTSRRLTAVFAGMALSMVVLSGCLNSRLSSQLSQGLAGITGITGNNPTSSSSGDTFVIGNVTVVSASTGATPLTTIFVDPSQSKSSSTPGTPPLVSQHCASAGTSGTSPKPCVCQFTWSETNSSSGNNLPFRRVVQTAVSNVQQEVVTCNAPSDSSDVYDNEIDNGTTIQITVLPGSSNPDAGAFSFTTTNYVKSTTVATGSFADAQGHAFDNIVHYSCFEQFKVGTSITSKVGTGTNSQSGEPVKYPIANQFCLQKSNTQPSPDCPTVNTVMSNSVQAYYYNFFARSSQAGAVNQWNDRYTCPSVQEPIYGTTNVGNQSKLYPFDAQFALSQGQTSTFNVGVNAFVELSDGGSDPISAKAQTCDGQVPAGNSATDQFVQACLGFAAKPNADGSCPYIRDSNGLLRFTYRLRRYIAIYPPLFGIDGKAPTNAQRTDTIYVLDRPVTPPSGNDPLKPFTMRGPKPCPFAMFDGAGVTGNTDGAYPADPSGVPAHPLPAYVGTNDPAWTGKNPDNIHFPDVDNAQSCSAAIPLFNINRLNPDLTQVTVATVNSQLGAATFKRVYVRPTQAWAPHYEEDTSFQACAPQATPFHDPPLHFAKDPVTGNVAWCAESYPSQNDHVAALDRTPIPSQAPAAGNAYIGRVKPFTSHVAKNSTSANCAATIPSSIPTGALYPATAAGAGGHTCAAGNGTVAALARHPFDIVQDTKPHYVTPADTSSSGTDNLCTSATCDRTAVISGGVGWQQFPLLADAQHVESALQADSSYQCSVTFDSGGNKAGKVTPGGGCCGSAVTLKTGLAPPSGPTSPAYINKNAHLEPDSPCLTPTY